MVMFHYPIAEWNGQINGSIHLFGHIHTIKSTTSEYMNKLNSEYGYKCINVGIDVHKRLLNLEELL